MKATSRLYVRWKFWTPAATHRAGVLQAGQWHQRFPRPFLRASTGENEAVNSATATRSVTAARRSQSREERQ